MKIVRNLRGPSLKTLFVLATLIGATWAVRAFDGGPHAGDWLTWNTGAATFHGNDPHETVDDVTGLTDQVGAPAMVTSMENTCASAPSVGGNCGLLWWNPATNAFKTSCVTGGFQFAIDINRGAPSAMVGTFGGGDTWATVNGNAAFAPYMAFRGSSLHRRWDGINADEASGIRVDPSNGKVYFGNFNDFSLPGFPGQIIELDPATDAFKQWTIGNHPFFLVIHLGKVYATAADGGGFPDQIVELDPATNIVRRWDIPGGGLLSVGAFGVGTPNHLATDLEGQLWFSETASNEIGRLNVLTNVFEEFAKTGIAAPHGIASSGFGPTLQAFFTEAGADQVSVLTRTAATPTTTPVAPSLPVSITPATGTATHEDFTPEIKTETITPVAAMTTSTDPSGIDRFPIPGGTNNPTGMTDVAFPNTVFGSMEGSEHVFQFVSSIIVGMPTVGEEEKVTGGGFYPLSPMSATFGFNVQRKETGGAVTGELEYQNHVSKKKIHLKNFTTLTCTDTNADMEKDQCNFHGSGTSSSSPTPVMCDVEVHDNNEPGTKPPKDSFKIMCNDGENTGGDLKGGNIQIHKPKA